MRISRWAVPGVIVAVALAAAGCGGGSDAAAPAATTAAGSPAATGGTSGSAGTLSINGGSREGTYPVTFCFSGGASDLTLSASGDDQKVDVQVSGGSGSLLVANNANTELVNGQVDALSVTGDGTITGSGTYTDGTPFTLGGACTGTG